MADLISRQAALDAVIRFSTKEGASVQCTDLYTEINSLPSAQPDLDEWCTDCKEYDQERHCCPRWSRVIRQILKDAQPEQRWIPCSERLPSEGENVLLCDTRFGNVAIGRLIRYNTSCCWEVDHWDCDIEDWQAWMPLPEPWEGKEHEQHAR